MVLTDVRNCPTFVINLDRRKDRWDLFSSQVALNQFPKFERFSAVDGAKQNVLSNPKVSLHTRQNIAKKFRRSHYEICTAGAIGASLSHITLWENFLKTDEPYLVVFEDDTIVSQDYLDMIDALTKRLPANWDLWLLGTHRWAFKGEPLTGNPKGWWSVSDFTGAHAQILSRRGAEILLEQPYPIETHIEYQITACAALKGLKIVKHPALRMGYFAELTEEQDSDTFDSRKSCPVCQIPDNQPEVGFQMSYMRLGGIIAAMSALSIVGLGGWLSGKKFRSGLTA